MSLATPFICHITHYANTVLLAVFLTSCTPGPSAAALAINAIRPPAVTGPLGNAPPAIRIGIAGHVVYLDPAPWLATLERSKVDTTILADPIETFDPANSEQLIRERVSLTGAKEADRPSAR